MHLRLGYNVGTRWAFKCKRPVYTAISEDAELEATAFFLPPETTFDAMDLASVKPFPDLPTDVARYILEVAA